jgi:hypothetical protein
MFLDLLVPRPKRPILRKPELAQPRSLSSRRLMFLLLLRFFEGPSWLAGRSAEAALLLSLGLGTEGRLGLPLLMQFRGREPSLRTLA